MHKHVRPGALIVAHPSLAQVTGHLDLGFDLDSWVEKVHIRNIPDSRVDIDRALAARDRAIGCEVRRSQ
jgi:hypothetical protein